MRVVTRIEWQDGRITERVIDWRNRMAVASFARMSNAALSKGAKVTTVALHSRGRYPDMMEPVEAGNEVEQQSNPMLTPVHAESLSPVEAVTHEQELMVDEEDIQPETINHENNRFPSDSVRRGSKFSLPLFG